MVYTISRPGREPDCGHRSSLPLRLKLERLSLSRRRTNRGGASQILRRPGRFPGPVIHITLPSLMSHGRKNRKTSRINTRDRLIQRGTKPNHISDNPCVLYDSSKACNSSKQSSVHNKTASRSSITECGRCRLSHIMGQHHRNCYSFPTQCPSEEGAEGAALVQIKLVWEYSSLKSIQYMDAFIKSHCRALEVPAVLDQAIDLQEKWTAATASDPLLASRRVRDPNSHQELTQSHFADLYYAAITYAKVNKMIGENFQMSASHISAHTTIIDKYIRKMATAELGELSEDTKAKLTRLGYPISRRRGRDSDDEDSDDEPRTRRSRRRQ